MCNLYTQKKSVDEIARLFRELELPLGFPEGVPNLQPKDIAITDPGADRSARRGEAASSWSCGAGAGPARAASRSITSAPKGANSRAGAA